MVEEDPTPHISLEGNYPDLKPSAETWAFCQELGRMKNLSPEIILRALTGVGERIAKLEISGAKITVSHNGKDEELCIFNK